MNSLRKLYWKIPIITTKKNNTGINPSKDVKDHYNENLALKKLKAVGELGRPPRLMD